jgi:uncharacterized NAD(P)/FAD-binding protein YdhS
MAHQKRVALVGGGPTAVYTLKNLLQKADGLRVTIFEAGKVAGCGIPYSDEFNTPDMMANITSVEIPPVMTSLADWVRSADKNWLGKFGVRRDEVGERDYYPRVLLGAYYVDQLEQMIRTAAPWHQVNVETQTRVLDIIPDGKMFKLAIANKEGERSRRFDAVILATGHLTEPATSHASSRLYRSPYPVSNLELAGDDAALILGSSLSAIDAAVALARRYGDFVGEDHDLSFRLRAEKQPRLVMVSRKGTVPDADFFYPIPEEPLMIFTPARLKMVREEGRTGLLARAFALFKQQLAADDPDFLDGLALSRFTPEAFSKAYLTLRKSRQGFEAIAKNLGQSQADYRDRRVVMWRYTMMRAHEVFATMVPFLDDRDLERFRQHLAPVFADAYGCVPHVSLSRLLSLHRAGCLDIVALEDSGTIRYGAGSFALEVDGKIATFGTLIDARGQKAATISQLGFETLDQALATADVFKRASGQSEDDQFRLRLEGRAETDIFCISIPVMMERYPFAQGLVACSEAAETVAAAI